MSILRFAIILSFLVVSCTATSGSESDDIHRVAPGKTDNYYSNVAREFEVRGAIELELTADEFADEAVRQEKADRRITAAVTYLTTFVTKKLDKFFSNEEYGGFAAMVRNRLVTTTDFEERVDGSETTYWANFAITLAGPTELPGLIGNNFELLMPKGKEASGGSLSTVRSFNPETYSGEIESIEVELRPIAAAGNAYPHYEAFVEDGVYDITMFQGYDYNEGRSDLMETIYLLSTFEALGFDLTQLDLLPQPDARLAQLYDDIYAHYLKEEEAGNTNEGFSVADWWARLEPYLEIATRMTAKSGPISREISFGGRPVLVEARIFHTELFDDSSYQKQTALDEFVARDVFYYNGHAGPWYGFSLNSAGTADVKEADFAQAPFTDRQQLFVANGCQTYSQYADTVYAHELKSVENLDVITTVNYSYGQGAIPSLAGLLHLDERGELIPHHFEAILTYVNDNETNREKEVFYGVTGIEENPRVHPYANPQRIGEACTASAECGHVWGNVCVSGACGVYALDANACPEGTFGSPLADGDTIFAHGCFAQPL